MEFREYSLRVISTQNSQNSLIFKQEIKRKKNQFFSVCIQISVFEQTFLFLDVIRARSNLFTLRLMVP